MEYVFEKNGKIRRGCGSKLPNGAIPVKNWNGKCGEPWAWYKKGIRISDDDLISIGIRVDERGKYFDSEKGEHFIHDLDTSPDDNWTREAWGHPTDELINGLWVEKPEKKKAYEMTRLRSKRRQEFRLFDKYQLPRLEKKLSNEQKQEYENWCLSWQNAPETLIEPIRPDWFQE